MPGEILHNTTKPLERPGKKSVKGRKRESLAHLVQLNPVYIKHGFKSELGQSFSNTKQFQHGKLLSIKICEQ